jgi:hypothetical protein
MDERDMPDDDNGVILGRFIADLNHARAAAGMPSYARLAQLSLQLYQERRSKDVDLRVLSRSTTQEILTGQREGVPPWPWVLSYVTVLRFVAKKAGVRAESIGGIADWKRMHEAVCVAELPAPRPVARRRARSAGDYMSGPDPLPAIPSARETVVPDWVGPLAWVRGRDTAPERLPFYLYLESAASLIRVYKPGVIPGLLQAEGYSRATVSRGLPDAGEAEVGRLVELRTRRQRVLDPRGGRQLWAVVEETTLRSPWPGREVMRAQIRHLIDIAEQPNVAIGVLPPGIDDNTTIREAITIFRFAEPHLGDVACLGQRGAGQFLYDRENTAHYSQLMDILAIRTSSKRGDVRSLLSAILRES